MGYIFWVASKISIFFFWGGGWGVLEIPDIFCGER